MFVVETSSMGVVSFALNLDAVIRDLDISRGLEEEDLEDLEEDPRDFEQDLKDLEDSMDFEQDFKDVEEHHRDFEGGFKGDEDQQWIDIETGSSNVLDEEVSSLLLGSRSASGVRNPGRVSLLMTRSSGGGGSEEEEEDGTGVQSRSRRSCQRRARNNSVMMQQRPSLDFDKMQRTCFRHRHTENGVKKPPLVRIRSLGRFSSVFSQRHPVRGQSTSLTTVTLDPSAFTFRSLSLRHGLKVATPNDRPSRAF